MYKGCRSRFTVQSFRENGQGLEAEAPQPANDEAHALRKVERMATGKAGAVAFRLDGSSETAEDQDPIVLKVVGRVPAIFSDLPF